MTTDKPLSDPRNLIVAVFPDRGRAQAARDSLLESGADEQGLMILTEASDIDTSPEWFADTQKDLERLQRELDAGRPALSVLVRDGDEPKQFLTIVEDHGAQLTTHFGDWVTTVI